jgi:hypothetical protein
MTMQRDRVLAEILVQRMATVLVWDDTRLRLLSKVKDKQATMIEHKIMDGIAGPDGRDDRATTGAGEGGAAGDENDHLR